MYTCVVPTKFECSISTSHALPTLTIANPIKYIATIWNDTLFIIMDMVKA